MSNFKQAIKWLKEGKGVKRTNWRIDGEVHLILKKVDNEMKVFDSYGKPYKFDYDIYECPEELKGQLKLGDFFG